MAYTWEDKSSRRCAVAQKGNSLLVTLPNRQTIQIDEEYFPINWAPKFTSDNAASRLWHRSLTFLPVITNVEGGWQIIERILKDFEQYIQADNEIIKIPSMDHSIAIQIRVLLDLTYRAKKTDTNTRNLTDTIRRILPAILQTGRAPGIRLPNNHGVMLSISLLLAATEFPQISNQSETEADAETAIHQIDAIFAADGVCNENTASYQRLYVTLLNELCILAEINAKLSQFSERFRRKYKEASTAFQQMLMPGGYVPPLGDGGLGRETELSPLPGTLISPINGLFVNSDDKYYLSVICGASSPVHKQMDDTSIFLSYYGRPLILDAGVLNYDVANPRAAKIRTQLGHSGLYFTGYDDKPLSYFNTGPKSGERRVKAKMKVDTHSDRFDLDCSYKLNGNYAQRTIRAYSPNSLELIDRVWSVGTTPAKARFLVDGSLSLNTKCGQIEAQDDDVWVRLTIAQDSRCDIKTAEVAWSIGKVSSCWMLEFEVPPGGRSHKISIEAGANSHHQANQTLVSGTRHPRSHPQSQI